VTGIRKAHINFYSFEKGADSLMINISSPSIRKESLEKINIKLMKARNADCIWLDSMFPKLYSYSLNAIRNIIS